MTGNDFIIFLLSDLLNGGDITTVSREYLLKNLLRYARGQSPSLDAAFGLTYAGQRRVSTQLITFNRDLYLSRAAEHIALDARVSTWQRAGRLADELSKLLPIWKKQYGRGKVARPDPEWPIWRRMLFMAWRFDSSIPCTQRRIYDLLQGINGYSFQTGIGSMGRVAPYIGPPRNENLV